VSALSEKTIICRCEDLSVEEIREWIEKGYGSFEEIKRASRIGMGACQGRTCRRHLVMELARAAGKDPADIDLSTFRPPTKPLKFGAIAGDESDA
jgi:bacterioferritin-associated ferredoxin